MYLYSRSMWGRQFDDPIEMGIMDGLRIRFAGSSRRRKTRLKLVTNDYLEEGYITIADLDDNGLYVDAFEQRALPYEVVNAMGETVASMRLIFGILSRLPVRTLKLNETIVAMSRFKCCEMSQVVVRKDYRQSRQPQVSHLMAGLAHFGIVVAAAHNARRIFTVVNESLYGHIGQTMSHLPIELAGPPQKLIEAPYLDDENLFPLTAPTNALLKRIALRRQK